MFEDFISGLITTSHCTVTYKTDDVVVQTQDTGGGHYQLYYYDQGGHRHPINVNAVQDNPNNDQISMCVPAQNVQPNAPYLAESIAKFMDPNIADAKKQAFLLGLLLLKRCR